jgi:predicted RNA binding protein YcfA (HicA-like mRNA interferase family)
VKSREFERKISSEGAVLEKKDGDHHIWRLPNGRRLIVPVGGRHTEAKPYLLKRYESLKQPSAVPVADDTGRVRKRG